jgi:hypothetical protein
VAREQNQRPKKTERGSGGDDDDGDAPAFVATGQVVLICVCVLSSKNKTGLAAAPQKLCTHKAAQTKRAEGTQAHPGQQSGG